MGLQCAHLLNEPVDGTINVFFTVCFVYDASGISVRSKFLWLVRFCSQKTIATRSDSEWTMVLVECPKNSASRYRG
jgi:hypothetical protein